ncbi:Fc receptor-like protein 4 [Channa argus]|uniref:Fc receptor-like protein 4 n=1 Tax=Channa argus TaxID=215402 RepID=UPI003520102F
MRGGNNTDWLYKFNRNGQQLVSFSTKNSYSLKLTADLSGDYQCMSNHQVSNLTKYSNKVTLSVSEQKPTATLSTDRTAVGAAGAMRLTCSVEGSGGWKYEWFRRAPDSSEAQIRADVPNKSSVTLQPSWPQIFTGETVTIRCEIQGGGDTEWEYEWRTTSSNTPPAHSEYRISSASVSYIGTYWCKGRRDLYSSTDWSSVILTVSSNKPRPTVRANKRTMPAGDNVTLTCAVENSAGWKYYWYRGTAPSSEAQIIRDGDDKDINISQGGKYHCRGGRGNPVYFTEDSDAVGIEKYVSNKAVVTLQPNWPLIFSGETITVRCGIEGGGNTEWEYEWSKPSSDTQTHEYNIVSASVSNSGNYRCMGKHKGDSYKVTEWSDLVTLRVSPVRPIANLTADNTVVPVGGSVTLSCSVNPSSSGWKYFWYRGTKTSKPLTSQEAAYLSGQSVSVSQEGLYWCRGGRGDPVYYTEYSDSVSVQTIMANWTVVTPEPNWPWIYTGETITLRCEIQGGDTEWEYEWETTSSEKPPHQNEYRISSASYSHSGDYWCKGRLKRAPHNSTRWSFSFRLKVSYSKSFSHFAVRACKQCFVL